MIDEVGLEKGTACKAFERPETGAASRLWLRPFPCRPLSPSSRQVVRDRAGSASRAREDDEQASIAAKEIDQLPPTGPAIAGGSTVVQLLRIGMFVL